MSRDYRRAAARPTPKRKQNRSCVWWFLAGTALGVFVSSLYSMRQPKTPVPPGTAATPTRDEQPARPHPNFKFQEILTDTEVDVETKAPPPPPSAPRPLPPKAQETPAAPRPPVEPAARSGTYLVQAGSFRRQADAERLKAELALLGISSRIQTATLPNGKITHRVRTGPFSSKQAAEQVRAQLKRNGKDGMTIPIR